MGLTSKPLVDRIRLSSDYDLKAKGVGGCKGRL